MHFDNVHAFVPGSENSSFDMYAYKWEDGTAPLRVAIQVKVTSGTPPSNLVTDFFEKRKALMYTMTDNWEPGGENKFNTMHKQKKELTDVDKENKPNEKPRALRDPFHVTKGSTPFGFTSVLIACSLKGKCNELRVYEKTKSIALHIGLHEEASKLEIIIEKDEQNEKWEEI